MYPGLTFHSYGSLNLTGSSPVQAFDEPLSRDEVKTYLSLPARNPTDAAEDDMIDGYISAAREIAEFEQGRDLVRKQWDLTLDFFSHYRIELREPLVSVDLIQYKDSSGNVTPLVEGTGFITNLAANPGFITPVFNSFWPAFTGWPTGAVLIRFTSGYSPTDVFWSDAGKRIKVGMLMLISGWFNNRLPYAVARAIQEYPYGVSTLLSYGGLRRVR